VSNILVTGGAGFIGSNFVRYWIAEHPLDRLVVLDALTYAGNINSLRGLIDGQQVTFISGDIRDHALALQLLVTYSVDTIVHFAAESHVDRSIAGPDTFVDVNVVGTHSLLKAARQAWLVDQIVLRHRFHHVSTDEVYGSLDPGDPPFTELTPYAPNSPYSATKASSDFLVRAYHHTYGLNTTITNCSNNFGPYQYPEKLIPLMVINCLRGLPLPVYGDGKNVRDWLYVFDHCRAIDLVLSSGAPGATYNVGGDCELPNILLIERICALIDEIFSANLELRSQYPDAPAGQGRTSRSLIKHVADRPGHDRRYGVDMSRIKAELGFTLSGNWEATLGETVRWYVLQKEWWDGRR